MNFRKETFEYIRLDDEVLEKYADVLVKFCLGQNNEGIQPNTNVLINIPEQATPLMPFLTKSVLDCGARPIPRISPSNFSHMYYKNASDDQLQYYSEDYDKAYCEHIDYSIGIICDSDKFELDDIPSERIIMKSKSMKNFRELRNKKENNGDFSWVLGMYPSLQDIEMSGVTANEFIENFIESCYLDSENPVETLRNVNKELKENADWLTDLEVKSFNIKDDIGTELTVGMPVGYLFKSGISANIPSMEAYSLLDWRTVEGKYISNNAVYKNGKVIKDINLEFKNGLCVEWNASEGQDLLDELLKVENGDKFGEIAFTSDISRIKPFYTETLMTENLGSSCHLALGQFYHDCFKEDLSDKTPKELTEEGFSCSVVHTDIVNSNPGLKVTATLNDGKIIDIFEDGKFKM